jgi:hypothetical protein
MDAFLIGPQSDEYTWWDYEMEYGDDDSFIEDNDEVSLSNDLASSTNGSR